MFEPTERFLLDGPRLRASRAIGRLAAAAALEDIRVDLMVDFRIGWPAYAVDRALGPIPGRAS